MKAIRMNDFISDIHPVSIAKDFSPESLRELGKESPYYRYLHIQPEVVMVTNENAELLVCKCSRCSPRML
jgi:hypothetical protein